MGKLLSMQEIRDQHPGEWLLIAYADLDEEMNVKRGQVLAHSPNRDEIYRALLTSPNRAVAIKYTGEIPEDLAVVL